MDQHVATKQPLPPPAPMTRRPAVPQSTTRDLLVGLTVPLVAVAVALGLHLQLDVGIGAALTMAMELGVILGLAHLLYRRGRTIKVLRDECARAVNAASDPRSPAQRGSREAGREQRMAGTATYGAPAATPAMPPPAQNQRHPSGSAPWPGMTQLSSPAGASPIAGPAVPTAAGQEQRSAPSPRLEAGPVEHPRRQAVPPPLPARFAPPAQAVGPAPAAAGIVPEASAPLHSPSSVPQHPARPEVPSAAAVRESAPDLPASAGPAPTPEAGMTSYWGHRPGTWREPVLPSSIDPPSGPVRPVDLDALSSLTLPSGPSEQAPSEARAGAANASLPLQAEPVEAVADAQELRVMQNLIEQLAHQLNAGKAQAAAAAPVPEQPAPSSHRAQPVTEAPPSVEQSLATSVAVLKATAETMREAIVPTARGAAGDAGALPAGSMAAEGTRAAPQGEAVTADPAAARPEVPAPTPYARLAAMMEAVGAERIDVHLDPILGLGDRKARHFEVGVRLRTPDGMLLDPQELASVAAGSGLLPQLDAAKIARTARVADRLGSRGNKASLFSGLAGESLSDDTFLGAFEKVFDGKDALLNRLVLSLAQDDVRGFSDGHWDAVSTLAGMGLRFALDGVSDLDMDFEHLKANGFEFIKLDARVFLEGLPAADGPIPAPDLCRHLAKEGLALIVGHIDDDVVLAKVLGFGVMLGQGTLFGGPRPVSIDMALQPTTVAA